MTYQELEKLCIGKHLPVVATNEDGENVIIAQCCDIVNAFGHTWQRNYFDITTAQHNGWTRHNIIHENGHTEEFYEMR